MKLNRIKTPLVTVFAFVVLFILGCKEKTVETGIQSIFPKGELGAAENFTGKVWNIGLVSNDTIHNTVVGNVYFEPSARSNWHSHPAGQILIITDGIGYHQIKGEPKQIIKKGDALAK